MKHLRPTVRWAAALLVAGAALSTAGLVMRAGRLWCQVAGVVIAVGILLTGELILARLRPRDDGTRPLRLVDTLRGPTSVRDRALRLPTGGRRE